ncbi:MAG: hypothetical protein IPK99_11005 [Flavobacteriales bacterium]|nr:hypothetical protein [Flavobacteriales bacterium]
MSAPNCATSQYTATVNVTALGDAPNVNIISSIHGTIATGCSAAGPYPSHPNVHGTPESRTVVHTVNPICNISLGPVNVNDGDKTCFGATEYTVSNTFRHALGALLCSDPGSSLGRGRFRAKRGIGDRPHLER